ncbi:unnamed protein product [Trifolium pratense]|uniref:Uncharacterized protein n=1 Tax=Trifolium pratense TaxID=57577 RepID=A0ACB0JD53_TRIPR|nr:unnamed protein product [Trifolium pratense]
MKPNRLKQEEKKQEEKKYSNAFLLLSVSFIRFAIDHRTAAPLSNPVSNLSISHSLSLRPLSADALSLSLAVAAHTAKKILRLKLCPGSNIILAPPLIVREE